MEKQNEEFFKPLMEKNKIAKAIISVMKAVKGMEKKSKVGSGKSAYDGTKDMDVKDVFNEEMAKAGLCIMPISIDASERVDRWEEVDQWSKETPKPMKSKQSIFTTVSTKYMLLHESGQSIELAGYGHGVDPQDKGAGKATTYALKNCLLLTFLTPVGKMPDTDITHSNEIATPQKNYEILYSNASNLEELKMLWDGLGHQEQVNTRELKETRKKEILNFKTN